MLKKNKKTKFLPKIERNYIVYTSLIGFQTVYELVNELIFLIYYDRTKSLTYHFRIVINASEHNNLISGVDRNFFMVRMGFMDDN